jgi:[acyl-carrier-protein] S-malonyltransferase
MSDNEFDNYSSKVAFMFPGQGAQYVGMAASICDEVPAAKALFETANGILGYDLLDRCKNGPKEVLDSTVSAAHCVAICAPYLTWKQHSCSVSSTS